FELRWAAMGQGLLTGSTLNLAQLVATIARGGASRPLRTVHQSAGEIVPLQSARPFMEPAAADLLASYMAGVTGSRATPLPSLGVAGKTGTASVADKPNNGWYVGFKPWAGPTSATGRASGETALVIAVLVEGGRTSARAAELSYHLFNELG
ncbi:MAG: penicillin-binding transpeptidase domain-containing protein, partial [Bacteroidota bacterium]